MKEYVIDIETTGLSLRDKHRIIEVGCIELNNKKRTGNIFHEYINPQRKIDEEAVAIHGIKNDFLIDKPIFAKIALKLRNFIGNNYVVAHNGLNFDIKFLNHEFALAGIEMISEDLVIDTLILAKKKFPGSPATLDALCKKFDIDLTQRSLHGALLDAELLTSVYTLMQCYKQNEIFLEELQKKPYSYERSALKCYNRSFSLTEIETTMHNDMLQQLNAPLWLKNRDKNKI